jgi:hypothetical protein
MKRGYLSDYFEGVAAKRLSAVEADVLRSNQHEFNGVEGLREILGEPEGKTPYESTMLYLTDQDSAPLIEDATLTWYDVRQKARIERNVMRWEYRLYFPTTSVSVNFSPGDLLVIAKRREGGLLIIVAEEDSSIARQIEWLFGFDDLTQPGFSVKTEVDIDQERIEFASRFILESIGISVEATEEKSLDEMLSKFSGRFPTTNEFSAYARSTLKGIDCREDPDAALMAWMEREEILFRTLERHLIAGRISEGFGVGAGTVDVDGFLSFSLSVQNRRKSRVGLALENHLEVIFRQNNLRYSRASITEHRSKPDFLFPSQAEYRDPDFDVLKLTMLGVKSTCKDRWRQVLAEADRIANKHLLTLETAISIQQTDEMASKNLQLVLPKNLHETYSQSQQSWLISLIDFTELVRSRQP